MPMWDWHGGWGWLWMLGAMLVFWAFLVAVVVLVVRWLRPGPSIGPERDGNERPKEILAERFARGEIDEEEFHQWRRVLTH
jgi:putative membrane protein